MKKRSQNVAAEQGIANTVEQTVAVEGQPAAEEGVKKVLPPLKRGALLALLICGIGCFAAIPTILYASITILIGILPANFSYFLYIFLGSAPLIGLPLLAAYLFRRVERTLPKRERVGKLAWAALGITGLGFFLLLVPFYRIIPMQEETYFAIKLILVLAISVGQGSGLIAACTHHESRKRFAVGLCAALLPLAIWDILLIVSLITRVPYIYLIVS